MEMSTKNGNVELSNAAKDFEAKGAARVVVTKLMTGIEATFTLVSFLLNVAQMTLPFCFARVGWSAAFLMMLAGGLCMHTALMLQEALVTLVSRGTPFPEYSDLARSAFGPAFAAATQAVAMAELAAYSSNCSINLGKALGAMLPVTESTAIMAGAALCVLLSAFSDRVFAYIGLLSSLASVSILVILVYSGWQAVRWSEDTAYIADPQYIPTSFAMILFTAGTHPLICTVLHSTRSHAELRRAILGAWTVFLVVTIGFGSVAYGIFGPSLQPDIIANIGGELKVIAGVWMAIKVLGNAVPLARPLGNAYARALGLLRPTESAGPLVMLPIILCLSAVAMYCANQIEAMESVVGCTITSFNVLLIPAMAYIVICKPSGASRYCAICYAMLGAGLSISPMVYFLWQFMHS
ncbi:unnamed protein product [Symbiodinium natans]|uniref:Amino acid transporter transmembrane domain-containing protein n=1 Tax=Symbiodinium natans TaxID=878477 RepID=A0A812SDD4_9DINO|nr:unnamed protein product [Symbiodinium natans]